jgi:NADP-dependent 3-hydroxy acid dehydrogenase YdfG
MIISGSIAIVTGASSGIGKSFTEHLLQKGATVYGLSRNLERMQAHKDTLGAQGEQYYPVHMDISDHDAMMHPDEVANTLIHVLETSDNFLINEITMRPLQPNRSK